VVPWPTQEDPLTSVNSGSEWLCWSWPWRSWPSQVMTKDRVSIFSWLLRISQCSLWDNWPGGLIQ
jgi:hypothetical protein